MTMWHDTARNVVVYDTPNDDNIIKRVPGAVKLHNGYVACQASLYNLQLLRYLGYHVPPPMEHSYDWPGRYEPFGAQRVTANFLAVHPRAFVLSDMGTGKTLAALWAADYIMAQQEMHSRAGGYQHCKLRSLIVAPLSTLQRVWADAIFQNFLGRRKAIVVYGSAEKRKELLAMPADFYILNFDGVAVLKDELAKRGDIRMAIVDEASAYRDFRTKRHKLARTLLGTKDYLWMMTGTPTPNGPTDAYGLAKLVNNAFGESFTSYQSRVMTKVSMFKWVPKTGSHAEAHRLLSPSVRFAIEDCVDLPPCTTQMREVELSTEQNAAYREMKRQLQLTVKKGEPITAANEAVLRMKLIQISCGAIYGEHREVHTVDAAPRIAALHEIIEQCSEKIIIFAPLTSVVNMLNKELKDYSRTVVNGEVPHKARSEIFRAFQQDASPRIIIADPGTMAHGLTLTAASTIIWYAPTDKTELYLQANKRIDRPGQVNNTSIVQLASTPIEREIYRRLDANEGMMGLVLKLAKGEL